MKPIKTLIVDDELIARKVMRHLLCKHDSITIVGEAATPQEAIQLAKAHRPNLLFLDIEMPTMNGFSLLDVLDYKPQVVFVTAHTDYAVQAFDIDATDYLIKPITAERLARSLTRIRHHAAEPPAAKDNIIYLRDCGHIHAIRRDDISAISADSNFTHIHRANAPTLFIRKAIGRWEQLLLEPFFVRLSRSLIINTHQIVRKQMLNRDKALLYLNGISEPFVLRRVALLRLRKIEDTFISRADHGCLVK